MAANVPMNVETTAEMTATESVTQSAFMMVESFTSASYQRSENPVQFPMVLELLKEKIISTRIGAYRNTSIRPR